MAQPLVASDPLGISLNRSWSNNWRRVFVNDCVSEDAGWCLVRPRLSSRGKWVGADRRCNDHKGGNTAAVGDGLTIRA